MAALARRHFCFAPDLRGFGDSEALPVDARRGLDDMADDLLALCDALDVRRCRVVGHSMGGGVAMKLLLRRPALVSSLALVNTLSPYGYSGSKDERGTPCHEDGAPAGAGTVNPEFVARIAARDRSAGDSMSPRTVVEQLYFKPPFVPDNMEELLDSVLATRVGDDWYPGDILPSQHWPGSAPGKRGVVNAMSRLYFDASGIIDVPRKPPILWVRGADDLIVADGGALEIGTFGASGAAPGWPGAGVCPPQPMLRQTRGVLDRYREHGGQYRECVLPAAGHTVFLEKPDEFNELLTGFLSECAPAPL